jgi:hypothetical protein
LLAVVGELALVAVAVRPDLLAFAVLEPGLEFPRVARRADSGAEALGQPVDAWPGVASLQLGVDDAASLAGLDCAI